MQVSAIRQENGQQSTYTLQYDAFTVTYSLRFTQRKTLSITVQPDGTIHVGAPLDTPLDAIEAKLKYRHAWIVKQQQEFAQYQPHLPTRQYGSGETHLYLGKQHHLTVQADKKTAVSLIHDHIVIATPDPANSKVIKEQLDQWYRNSAKQVFAEQLGLCLQRVASIGIKTRPVLRLRAMEKRWGSCLKTGIILLNPKLIQMRKPLIDYVITHELCHLKEHNHSRAFYKLLDRVMPDWQERKKALNLVKVI